MSSGVPTEYRSYRTVILTTGLNATSTRQESGCKCNILIGLENRRSVQDTDVNVTLQLSLLFPREGRLHLSPFEEGDKGCREAIGSDYMDMYVRFCSLVQM